MMHKMSITCDQNGLLKSSAAMVTIRCCKNEQGGRVGYRVIFKW